MGDKARPFQVTRRTWFKMFAEEWLDGTMRFQLSHEQRAIWADLLALAARSRYPGIICAGETNGEYTPYPSGWIARRLNHSARKFRQALVLFEQQDRISNENGVIKILSWSKYQSEYKRQLPFRSTNQGSEVTEKLLVEADGDGETEGEAQSDGQSDGDAAEQRKATQATGPSASPPISLPDRLTDGLTDGLAPNTPASPPRWPPSPQEVYGQSPGSPARGVLPPLQGSHPRRGGHQVDGREAVCPRGLLRRQEGSPARGPPSPREGPPRGCHGAGAGAGRRRRAGKPDRLDEGEGSQGRGDRMRKRRRGCPKRRALSRSVPAALPSWTAGPTP